MQRWKKSELALLLLPTLFLGGVAIALRHRAGAHLALPDDRFRLIVNRVEFLPVSSRFSKTDVSGRPGTQTYKRARALRKGEGSLQMAIHVDYSGHAPKWWLNDKMGRPPFEVFDVVITDKNHKQTRYPCFWSGSGRDGSPPKRRYHVHASCYVPKDISLRECTITASVWLHHAGTVRFLAPLIINGTKDTYPNMFDGTVTPGIKTLKFVPEY